MRRYRWRDFPRLRSQTWGTFLRTHAHDIWAADLFTVQTVAYKTPYVLLFITHGRRALVHSAVHTLPIDCLDHVLVLNERHLRVLLRDYMTYYNTQRPHRSLDLAPPLPAALAREPTAPAPVRARALLGGPHHVYERAA